jgi:hypothetical protein
MWEVSGQVVRVAFVIVLTAVWLANLSFRLGRAAPSRIEAHEGTIRPDRWSAWLTVITGSLLFAVFLVATIAGIGGWKGPIGALLFAAAAAFMAPSLTSVHAVNWNANCIEGPSRLFGPTLGFARTMITWVEIVRTGTTITSYWYVESRDGRRVFWSYLYRGHGALAAALQEHRPDLQLEFD